MTFFVFLLALGAALRLTRLVVEDTIFAPIRRWMTQRYAAHLAQTVRIDGALDLVTSESMETATRPGLNRDARVAERRGGRMLFFIQMFECPWCVGFWLAAATSAAALSPLGADAHWWAHTWLFVYPALALSISYLIGLVTTVLATIEEMN